MVDLVTADEARDHLRIDNDADDSWLSVWIPAISQAVMTWLKDEWRVYESVLDSNGDPIVDSNGDHFPEESSNGYVVRPVVKAAVLVELAQQYRFRDGSGAAPVASHWGHGYTLGMGATSLLSALRKSTLR